MKAEGKRRRCDACGHDHDDTYTIQSPLGRAELNLCAMHLAAGMRHIVSRCMVEPEFTELASFVKRVKLVGL